MSDVESDFRIGDLVWTWDQEVILTGAVTGGRTGRVTAINRLPQVVGYSVSVRVDATGDELTCRPEMIERRAPLTQARVSEQARRRALR